MSLCVCFGVWLLLVFGGSVVETKTPLYIAGLFPLSPGGWIENYGNQSLISVSMAIDLINNRSDILPEHELILVYNDSKVCY